MEGWTALDAFADWSERQERLAKGLEISSTSTSAGSEGIRAAAFASAPTNIWRPDALPDYLQRLHAIRFSAEWDRARHEGTLQTPRIDEPIHCLSWTGVPILLLHGRQDMVFPTALADQAAALLPNAHAIVLDDAGHMAHIDQPERWLAAIERFLR